jgi:hypothetical protein
LLTDGTSSSAFATAIAGTSRAFNFDNTAPGSAINWGVGQFTANGYEGARLVIDVSGDGVANDGANTFAAASAATLSGFRINGLSIGDNALDAWYIANICTPGGGTCYNAATFADFNTAISQKIGQEIAGDPAIPEPATLTLLGLGMSGLAGRAWRKRKARG